MIFVKILGLYIHAMQKKTPKLITDIIALSFLKKLDKQEFVGRCHYVRIAQTWFGVVYWDHQEFSLNFLTYSVLSHIEQSNLSERRHILRKNTHRFPAC